MAACFTLPTQLVSYLPYSSTEHPLTPVLMGRTSEPEERPRDSESLLGNGRQIANGRAKGLSWAEPKTALGSALLGTLSHLVKQMPVICTTYSNNYKVKLNGKMEKTICYEKSTICVQLMPLFYYLYFIEFYLFFYCILFLFFQVVSRWHFRLTIGICGELTARQGALRHRVLR